MNRTIVDWLREECGIVLDEDQKVAFADFLRRRDAATWDDGASRAGRYGHEDGWWDGGPYRDNPYRSKAEIQELYGEEEDGW